MKHKLLTLLLAVMASVGMSFAETYSGSCGENLTWSLNTEDGVLTISGTGAMADYQNATQTPWNGYSSLIQSVIMNDNVTTVSNYAFAFCSNLKNVSLNQTLTTIGEHAFFSCPLLESVVIPDNVIVIGYNAFAQCSWLTSVHIGNKVTTIGKGAFARCGRLSSVVMFNSVTSIGENAFDNCSALTTINIPNSITSIGKETFAFCAALTSIEIPESVTSIGENAFYGCSGLTSIAIPNSVTTIGNGAFAGCTGLTSVTIGSSVTSIGGFAFEGCRGLTSITNYAIEPQTINSNVFTNVDKSTCTLYVPEESVEAYQAAKVWKEFGNIVAIEGDTPEPCIIASGTCGAEGDNLTWTLTCDSVLTISGTGAMADYNSSNIPWYEYREAIRSAIIANGVTTIGTNAFYYCRELTSINIPSTVLLIRNYAFFGCQGLTSIEIPNSVTSIGDTSFDICTKLSAIIVAEDNQHYHSQDGVLFTKDATILIHCPRGKQGTYVIPNSVNSIKRLAFKGNEVLSSIEIPNSVTSIGDFAFGECKSLNLIIVAHDNSNYSSEDGVLFNKDKTTLIQYPGGKQGAYTIPNSVTSIEKYAFSGCYGITSVNIPESAINIGSEAFRSCNGLTSIIIGNSIANIEDYAFAYCNRLTTVTNYATTPQVINANVFNGVNKSTCMLYVPAESIAAYQAADVWKEFGNILAIEDEPAPCILASGTCGNRVTWELSCDSVLTISGTGAMAQGTPWSNYMSEIKSLIITNGVTSIGDGTFEHCDGLISIEIPNSVTSIGSSAFWGCSSLTSVTIPNSVTSIGASVFNWCDNLTSIIVENGNLVYDSRNNCNAIIEKVSNTLITGCKNTIIPNSVTAIGFQAFNGCRGLTFIEIPNSVVSIGNFAFSGCNGLTSVTIPNSVTSIGKYAFSRCSGLTSIEIPSSVTSIEGGAFYGCSRMTSINAAVDNPSYCSVEGVLFNKDITTLVQYPGGKRGAYTIPSSVTSIGDNAFLECQVLTSIEIPHSVTNIGYAAFCWCTQLSTITIPSSVTNIENEAFQTCRNLTSITNYATTPQVINANVFNGVNKSTCTLYVPAESVEAYQTAEVWKEFTNILPIGESVEADTITIAQALEIGAGLEVGASTDKQYTIRGYVSAISSSFSEQYGNQSFYIADDSLSTANSNATGGFYVYRGKPTTGTAIREGALVELTTAIKNYNGENIENAEQNVPVTVLEEGPECRILSGTCGENLTWTFNNCDSVLTISGTGAMTDFASGNTTPWYSKRNSINTIVFDGGITSIGYAAFSNCTRLNAVTIPNSVTRIGDVAFRYCISLSSITIPNSVTSIGERTFADCSSLGSVAIPNSVTSIEYGAFRYCTGLSSVTISKSVTNIGSTAFSQCTALTSVTNYAETPQPINANVFSNVDLSACTLYVPAESVDAYKAADVWKDFGNILPIGGGDTPSPEERTGQSTEGKDFWVTFLQADQDPNNDLVLSLSISSREDCQVMIANPYTGYMETVNVTANQMQLVELYSGNVLLANARTTMANSGKVCYAGYSEQVDTCALRVTATSDISLFATNYKRATFDATNVLPTALLGDEYFIQTYTPSDHGGVDRSQGSHFAIIATEDNTIVDYCPTVMTQAITDSVNVAQTKRDFMGEDALTEREKLWLHYTIGDTIHTPVLKAGQVFYVWTGKKDGETGDLSGTYVKARNGKRIAVFQGNPHTNIPYQVKQRDQLYSQAMPVQSWGSTFALTASAERPSDIIRVMALYDGTEVRINGETVHTFDFTVDTKHFWEFEIGPSGTYAQDGSCMLTTSQPVAVHLFLTSQRHHGDSQSNGDPAMLWVSPIEQQMEQVNFVTNDSRNGMISNYLNVVTDRPNSMTLDNISIASYFSPVSGSNTYHYAQITLGSTATAHTLKCNGGRFNAHVYGFTNNESYGYSVGGFIEDLTPHIYINGEPVSPVNDMCVSDTLFMDITTSFDYQSMKLDFGDGTVVYATDEEGIHARHAYDAPGVYQANVVVASNNNRLDSIPIRIIAGPLSLTYEPLNDIYVGDSIFYIYYHSPIQEMQIEEDFTIDRSFNDAALQDGFGHYTTRLNRSFFGIRIPEGARAGVEYAFNVDIHTLCGDYTATIPFVLKARRTGSCGDNLALTWTYDPETKTLTITGDGALNSNYTFGLEAPVEMEQLIIAEGVTSIGANAFSNMSTLQTMQLPASLKTIGASAFENDINLTAIYNYRERPCLVDATAFNGVNKFDCTLYVLEGSVDMYKSSISDWKDFYFILPIGTTEVTEPVSDVTVEPHDNSATVTWPTSNNAATYTIQITKDGVLFCTLIFNANGQLTGIAFAPGREGAYHAPAAIMTANGLQFTVTGLNSNTQYGYSVTAKDSNDQPIATYSGEFTTTSEGIATGVEDVQGNNVQCTKVVHNGQIFILRGDKTYTITGQEVK